MTVFQGPFKGAEEALERRLFKGLEQAPCQSVTLPYTESVKELVMAVRRVPESPPKGRRSSKACQKTRPGPGLQMDHRGSQGEGFKDTLVAKFEIIAIIGNHRDHRGSSRLQEGGWVEWEG